MKVVEKRFLENKLFDEKVNMSTDLPMFLVMQLRVKIRVGLGFGVIKHTCVWIEYQTFCAETSTLIGIKIHG